LAKQINWFRNRKSQTKGVGGGGQSLSHINSIQSDIKHIQFSLATQELYNQWLASEQNPPAPRICHLNPPKAPGLNPLNPGYLAGEEIKCGRHVATLLLISPALTDRQAQDDKDDKDDV